MPKLPRMKGYKRPPALVEEALKPFDQLRGDAGEDDFLAFVGEDAMIERPAPDVAEEGEA